MRGEFDGLFIIKQIKNPSKGREKHSITSRVSPYTSFVLEPLPEYFTTQQNKTQSRPFYLLLGQDGWILASFLFFFFLRFYGPQNDFSQYPCTAFITHPYTRTALSAQCSSNLANKPTGSCWF